MTLLSEKSKLRRPKFDYPWIADQGNGTFVNPILYADFPDPDVIRDGDDYYMVVSSFHCTPGLPILHSHDLVNWRLMNHAIHRLPHARYDAVQPGCGVWAPAIRKHAGKFWIFFPTPDEGIYVSTADHPAGDWSEPHLLQAGRGLIDPCPLWDEDGKAYLVHAYAGSRAGIKHILRVRPMSPDCKTLLGEGQIVFEDPVHHPTVEGPKFLKRNGYYYILAPAGGVENGWQLALRSRNICGPYEAKIVLEQGSSTINGPHQGALIDTPDGQSWFIHFQDVKPYGRIVHLQPVRWKDDWPMMGVDLDENGIGEPVSSFTRPEFDVALNERALRSSNGVSITSDEFDDAAELRLGLQWHWNANHRDAWLSLSARQGWLRLYAQHGPADVLDLPRLPSVVMQKLPSREFVAETLLEFAPRRDGDYAGLCVVGKEFATLALTHHGRDRELHYIVNGEIRERFAVAAAGVRLRIRVSNGRCDFTFHDGQRWQAMADDFRVVEGVWVGAKIGLFAVQHATDDRPLHADFDYLRFSPSR